MIHLLQFDTDIKGITEIDLSFHMLNFDFITRKIDGIWYLAFEADKIMSRDWLLINELKLKYGGIDVFPPLREMSMDHVLDLVG